jgi:hypothetical protein
MDALEVVAEDYIDIYEMWQDYQHENALMISPVTIETLSF